MTYSPNFVGNNALGSSRSIQTGYVNGSLSTISKGIPVSVNAFSQVSPVDVTSEASVQAFVGLMSVDTPSSASGTVVDSGRLENVTTSFSVGDAVYIGIGGTLINQKPDIGVGGFTSGDFVIFVGVVVTNEFNSLQKDFQLMLSVFGQL